MHAAMPQLTLHRAGPGDATAVRDLVRAAYARWVPLLGREPRPMLVDYDLAVRDHSIDLLHQDAALVALIEMLPLSDQLYIENIAVAPAQQGRGLGRKLLDHAQRQAEAANLPRLGLLTAEIMHANIRLYQSFGFRIDNTSTYLDSTIVHMSKVLPRP